MMWHLSVAAAVVTRGPEELSGTKWPCPGGATWAPSPAPAPPVWAEVRIIVNRLQPGPLSVLSGAIGRLWASFLESTLHPNHPCVLLALTPRTSPIQTVLSVSVGTGRPKLPALHASVSDCRKRPPCSPGSHARPSGIRSLQSGQSVHFKTDDATFHSAAKFSVASHCPWNKIPPDLLCGPPSLLLFLAPVLAWHPSLWLLPLPHSTTRVVVCFAHSSIHSTYSYD